MGAFDEVSASARRQFLLGVRCALLLASMLAGVGAASCEGGRFPVCKSSEECAARGPGSGGKVCYNLKCVQCRYDTDCERGNVCNPHNECVSIGVPGGDPEETNAAVSWEPSNWDECAARCKEKDCVHACDQRFRK